jgi:hypothetical protein
LTRIEFISGRLTCFIQPAVLDVGWLHRQAT